MVNLSLAGQFWPLAEPARQSLQALAGGNPQWDLVQQRRPTLPGWVVHRNMGCINELFVLLLEFGVPC